MRNQEYIFLSDLDYNTENIMHLLMDGQDILLKRIKPRWWR